jgi:hypothetical protein
MLVTTGTGLDYLNAAPARARARAAVLRAYVERFGDAVELGGNEKTMVSGLAKASGVSMRVAAYDIAGKLRDSRAQLAASVGVEVGKLEGVASDFSAAVLRNEHEVNEGARKFLRIDVMSLFRDLNKLAGGALADAMSAVARSLASTFAGVTAKATAAAGDLAASFGATLDASAASVSAAMPLMKAAVDIALQLEKDGQEAADAACLAWNQANVFGPLGEAAALGMPVPWHLLDVWYVSCETVPRGSIEAFTDDFGAANDARLALKQAQDLGFADAMLDARRWWGMLVLLAGDPLVERTLRAMGQQRGLWASDEAVAVVGVVVATAYQIQDVWGFVELLWGYAIGWAQYRELAKPYQQNKSTPELGPYFPLRDPSQREQCAAQPYNAWSLNYAAVASCAFVLAEEVKRTGALPNLPIEISAIVPAVDATIRLVIPR